MKHEPSHCRPPLTWAATLLSLAPMAGEEPSTARTGAAGGMADVPELVQANTAIAIDLYSS